jgi:NSS family neurotransmitter:Na+ symporter
MALVDGKHEQWSTRFGFMMAAIGSSVGLGNFWRFPFTAGENGGGAFILIYIACVVFLAFPILCAEYALGRRGGMSSVETISKLAQENKKSSNWQATAWIGGIGAFFILTFYNVIAGWVAAYIPLTFSGVFATMTPDEISGQFASLTSDPTRQIFFQFLFALATVAIVARGVKSGIETINTILMPLFFLMLVGLVGYAVATGDIAAASAFLFQPDFSAVTFKTFLAALGQACFSIGIGSALMITYGAYLKKDVNIPRSAGIIATSDTAVALIAGLAIFPIVFAFGLDAAGGPGLFFQTLPIAFGQMPGGAIFGGLFFLLALFAAITSSISLLEVAVSWFEERHGVNRVGAAFGLGFFIWVVGVAYTFSGAYIDFVDFLTGEVMLPLGAFLLAVFAGWIVDQKMIADELDPSGKFIRFWRPLIRYVAPIGVGAILIGGLLPRITGFFSALGG